MSVTGKTTPNFSEPVCNIFREAVLEGQLCYQADLNALMDRVDRENIAAEGFMFLLDYNLDRMVDIGGSEKNSDEELSILAKEAMQNDQAMIYIETLGTNEF